MTEYAVTQWDMLPGQVARPQDSFKHLGPSGSHIDPDSKLFQTRCHLDANDGPWHYTNDNEDKWCIDCLKQALLPYKIMNE